MYKSALTITRKLCFRLRRMLKNNDIAAHWESLSSSNFLVITLMFGHNKVRHDSQFLIPEHALKFPQLHGFLGENLKIVYIGFKISNNE